jgi:FG-GAP repeat
MMETSCFPARLGGNIFISAKNVEQNGVVTATSQDGAGGNIVLQASQRIIQTDAANIDASGTTQGGKVVIIGGQSDKNGGVFVSGSINANATQGAGGDITVTGKDLYFAATRINADGATDGGQIRLGGDYHGNNPNLLNASTNYLNTSTLISANGASGAGGRVIVWSDSQTTFGGSINADGATPSIGGLVEVSGKDQLHFAGKVSAKTLLLDPKNIVIDAAGSIASFQLVDPNPGTSNDFGASVAEVGSGNIAVSSYGDSFSASHSGAAYLFNGSTGALISTLRGSTANDQVGFGGITALTNGNLGERHNRC